MMRCSLPTLLLVCGLAVAQAADVRDILHQKSRQALTAIEARCSGVLGVAALDLTTGETLLHNAEIVFPQASSIKIPLMMQVFQAVEDGVFGLDSKVTLERADMVGGSGSLQKQLSSAPASLTVNELITLMIRDSDNTATNKLIAMVGMDSVNRLLDQLGFRQTRLRRIMMDSAAAQRGDENVSTPDEMVRIAELIYRGKAVSESASRRMIEAMKLVKADFRAAIPENVEVASKPGGIPGVRCETGIVYLQRRPFALSVMATYLKGDENPLPDPIRVVFAYFDKLAQSNRYGHKVH